MVEIAWLYGYVLRMVRVVYKAIRYVLLKEEVVTWLAGVPDLVVVVTGNGKLGRVISAGSFIASEVLDSVIHESKYQASVAWVVENCKENSFKMILKQNKVEQVVEVRIFPTDDQQLLLIVRDVTLSAKQAAELEYRSNHDYLTGLYNRNFFKQQVDEKCRNEQYPLGFIVADIDGLKIINDTYGHLVGDKLIIKASNVLKKHLRKEDVLARMGGDEFVLLLPGATQLIIDEVLLRIQQGIAQSNRLIPNLQLEMSFGSAVAKQGDNVLEILELADANMYKEKYLRNKWYKG